MASISILIPTYNYGAFLPRALDSVLSQTVRPLEILVGDDGSTDDTASVAGAYGAPVSYLPFAHQGVYALRTRLVHEARGDWVLNLDADNWLAPDFLERMHEALAAHGADERFAFAYPDMILHGEAGGRVERPEFDPQRLKRGNYIDMNSVIRTGVARKFGFDPAFNTGQGDYDFFLTLVEHGYRGRRVPSAILHYRVHADSLSRTASRRRRQCRIMRRIVRKHRSFFTREEARDAMASARNRLLVSLLADRTPYAGPGRRLRDWLSFGRAGWRHAEWVNQTRYCWMPSRFFRKQTPPAEVFYLFTDTPARRALLREPDGREGATARGKEQLFGYDVLKQRGMSVDHNLRFPRPASLRNTLWSEFDRRTAPRTGIGRGDVSSVQAALWQMNRARAVLATADRTGLPALRARAAGRLRARLVYVSIGLPERMEAVRKISEARARGYRGLFAHADCVVAYGHAEADWLQRWLGPDVAVRFIPFGVDPDGWSPLPCDPAAACDVLSIGADHQRDFGLLLDYARRRYDVRVGLIVSGAWAAMLGPLPPNVTLDVDAPVERVRTRMASAGVVVLPVKENTYSGATTTLLQAMAMQKAVAVSRVGAIREGYGFLEGEHLQWMTPGDQRSLDEAVDALLADPGHRRRLGAAARRHVEALNWDRYVDAIETCLLAEQTPHA